MKKPIKVSNGDFVTDSNFKVMQFTEKQAISFAKNTVKHLNNNLKMLYNPTEYRYTFRGLKDCGDYWTYTVQ